MHWWPTRKRHADLERELRSDLDVEEEEQRENGLSAEDARYAAQRAFGNAALIKEHSREVWGWMRFERFLQDVRYALRGFARNPVFTVAVIATLAVGIGATTAVFSVVDRILFRSLPYAHDDRLVSVGVVHSLERQEFMMGMFFFDWRDNQKPFEAMAIQSTNPHPCDLVEKNPAQLSCLSFDAGLLPLLGVSPVVGRNFLPEEDRPKAPDVVLISYGLWQDHYNRDPGILDRTINVDGKPVRVVGVLPKDFQFPTLQPADVIFTEALDRADQPTANGGFGYPMRTFARLKPGVSLAQAREEMEPLFEHTRDTIIPPDVRKDIHLSIRSLRDRETQDVQSASWILLGAVLAVLLIACANVASLMMARGAARERELAVRSALGASRERLIRQTLTEAALLFLAGATAGMALAEGLLRVFVDLAPTGIPFLKRAGLDVRIALLTMLLSLVCAGTFGLLPALQIPRVASLASRVAKSRQRTMTRRILVAGQIAISMILLSGAALLLKSFHNVEEERLGIQTGGVFTAQIALPHFRYNTGQKVMDFFQQAEAALRRLPGIGAVAISDSVPPGGWMSGGRWSNLVVEGKPSPEPGTGGTLATRTVTPDYFRALNIAIVRGRNFTEEERRSGQPVTIISRLMAARLFPGEDPIGRRIRCGSGWCTVIGVAENVKNGGLMEPDDPEIYNLKHTMADDWAGRTPLIIVDSALSPKATVPWVRVQIAHLDPTVPVTTETLNEQISKMADRPRFETALLGFFALCGLLMALIGLYGVIAFVATQRTQEIGIRMALGATRLDVLRLITIEGVQLIVLGGVIGLATALGTAQLLKSLLFNVAPHDPLPYAAVALFLALMALAATLIPARRAASVDPIEALRTE
jgi:predicted permease